MKCYVGSVKCISIKLVNINHSLLSILASFSPQKSIQMRYFLSNTGFLRTGVDPALMKMGGAMLKWWQVFNRGFGSMSPENFLDFGSLKWHFQHFEDTFEHNIKVSNHIVNRLSHHIFKKYFVQMRLYLHFQSVSTR